MLDWRAGDLLGHAPEYHSVNQLPIEWDPRATCPEFDRWVTEVLPPDLTALDYSGASFADMLLGYLITSGNPHQLAVLLLGSGGNGKSVFIKVIQSLIGEDNYSSVALRDLDENRFRAAHVYGKLANICGDLDSRRLEGTDMFKKITGGDMITAEYKYGRGFEFASYAVPLFSANAVFGTPDTSDGYFRRWLIVPFPNSFIGREDSGLIDRLTAAPELAGILARAVRGARALAALGRFPVPPSIAETREQFMQESDPVRAFLAECTERAPDGGRVDTKDIYVVYKAWCAQAGRAEMAAGTLNSRIAEAGYRVTKTR
jgi:P4 family phage/plasmid primase-like protien